MKIKKIIGVLMLLGMFLIPYVSEYKENGIIGCVAELVCFVILVLLLWLLINMFDWLFKD